MGKGPKAFAQISHAGAAADSQMTGCPVLGPSAASDSAGDPVFKNMNLKTKAMDSGDIKKCLRHFSPLAPIHGGIRGFLFVLFSCIIGL